jgi:hypothetical protein
MMVFAPAYPPILGDFKKSCSTLIWGLGAIPCSVGTYATRTLITLGCRNPRENLNLAMRLFVKLHYS